MTSVLRPIVQCLGLLQYPWLSEHRGRILRVMNHADLVIRAGRVEGIAHLVDVAMRAGVISAVEQRWNGIADREIDAGGLLISPAFVEPHIHLDKAFLWSELPPSASGTLAESIALMGGYKSRLTADDVADRAERAILMAVVNGTTLIRSHVDIDPGIELLALDGVVEARRRTVDIADVQIVAFPQEGIMRSPGTESLMRAAMERGANVVGGIPHWERTPEAARAHIDICFAIARDTNADVDMHVDETDDPDSRTLEMLARATIANNWQGRVVAGHCCALAAYDDVYARAVIELVREACITVVFNPEINLLLQGRSDHEPKRRGITRVKELLDAGVNVTFGQDDVQDGFSPFGKCDPLEVGLVAALSAQMTSAGEIETVFDMPRRRAASALGHHNWTVAVGSPANLVIFDAVSAQAAIATQPPRRFVIACGRVIVESTPSIATMNRHVPASGQDLASN